jgi:hypothetical protein
VYAERSLVMAWLLRALAAPSGGQSMSSKIVTRCLSGLAAIGLAAAAADAPAQTVLTACTTISSPGNYVLGNNITAAGNCFVLAASNVAIDFKGKKVTGNGDGAAITEDGSARNHLVISNGKIRNFFTGIALSQSGHLTIRKMDVSQNVKSGIFIGGCCNMLEKVKANDNGLTGIQIVDCCSIVTNSETKGNGGNGMDLGQCCHAVSDSTSSGNVNNGIRGTGCCISVNDSKFAENGDDGILLEDDSNIVSNSTVKGNGENGIELEETDNLVSRCKVKKNGGIGIKMDAGDNNQINATSSKANDVGVSIECPGTLVDVKASGNPGGNLIESGAGCTKQNAP